jgi:hypothetical protein
LHTFCYIYYMRSLFILLLVLSGAIGHSQEPFNYGKSKNIYFLSRTDIARYGIREIYVVSLPKFLKDVPDEAYVSIIDFSDSNSYRNGWYPYYGKAKKRLSLQELLDSSDFMNGSYYELNEDGKIANAGMEGKGALCREEYQHDSLYTLAVEDCKYGEASTTRKIFYHSNGLPKCAVCCEVDSFKDVNDEDSIVQPAQPGDYHDTTWYIYNARWQVVATRTRDGIKNIFQPATGRSEPGDRLYINKTLFENFIDKKIGYRPKMILFAIYRNAVLVFKYDAKTKKYFEAGEISIE